MESIGNENASSGEGKEAMNRLKALEDSVAESEAAIRNRDAVIAYLERKQADLVRDSEERLEKERSRLKHEIQESEARLKMVTLSSEDQLVDLELELHKNKLQFSNEIRYRDERINVLVQQLGEKDEQLSSLGDYNQQMLVGNRMNDVLSDSLQNINMALETADPSRPSAHAGSRNSIDERNTYDYEVRDLNSGYPAMSSLFRGRNEDMHQSEEIKAESDVVPEEAKGEHDQIDSDASSSSMSSDSDEWNPDSPYGSRRRMLKGIEPLKSGRSFADDYFIAGGGIAGRPHVRLAQQRFGKHEYVIIKFYWDESTFENTIEVHPKLSYSENICRILQTLKTPKTGFPPSIIFEKGMQTLTEWMRSGPSLFDKEWCLRQILVGIGDAHNKGIVHCDVKPSNIMFFGEGLRWKLIDLDGAREAGLARSVNFTTPYAPPEVLRELKESGQLPIAQPSMDIWSFGMVVYEVLTGERFFGDGVTREDVIELVEAGEVEEKIKLMENDAHREVVSNLLKVKPGERWSVAEVLQHPIFASDACTTTSEL